MRSFPLLLWMTMIIGTRAHRVVDVADEEFRKLEIRVDGRLLDKNEYKWNIQENVKETPDNSTQDRPSVWGALHGLKVSKVDLFTERVEATVSLTYSFRFAYVNWNPSDFDNLTETNLPSSKVSAPIIRGCSHTISLKEADNTDNSSKVFFNGTVSTTRSLLTTSECTMNFNAIPDDSHDCSVCLEFPPDVISFDLSMDEDVIFEGVPNEWNVKGEIQIKKSVEMSTKTRQVLLYYTFKRHADNINWVLRYVTTLTVIGVVLVQSKTSCKNIPSYVGMVIVNATLIATGEHIIMGKQKGWGGNAAFIVYAHAIMFGHSILAALFEMWKTWN